MCCCGGGSVGEGLSSFYPHVSKHNWFQVSHMVHGTGIFTYIKAIINDKFMIHVGKYSSPMEHLGLFCGLKPKHTTIFLLKVHGPMSACHIDPVVRKAPKKSLKLVGNGRTKDCTHVAWLAQPWSMFHRLGI